METYKFYVTVRIDNPDEFIADDDDIAEIVKDGLSSRYPRLQVGFVDCIDTQQ